MQSCPFVFNNFHDVPPGSPFLFETFALLPVGCVYVHPAAKTLHRKATNLSEKASCGCRMARQRFGLSHDPPRRANEQTPSGKWAHEQDRGKPQARSASLVFQAVGRGRPNSTRGGDNVGAGSEGGFYADACRGEVSERR